MKCWNCRSLLLRRMPSCLICGRPPKMPEDQEAMLRAAREEQFSKYSEARRLSSGQERSLQYLAELRG